MPQTLRCFLRHDEGATTVEFGLILSLVFLAVSAALFGYAESTEQLYGTLATRVQTANSAVK